MYKCSDNKRLMETICILFFGALLMASIFIVLSVFPPYIRTTGTVINVIDSHYAAPLLKEDPNSGKTLIDRSCNIQFYTFTGRKCDVFYQQLYLEDYPYSLQEGDNIELLYNPIIPSRIKIIAPD